ncbi:hypothetical protein [Methylobacterium sp. B1]|uniref:hypothetical protein n=1 Tax=Methylobacterium sp. B1 TaxID=91459 RepID=UPI000349A6FB|nr:hypothetical protein [Methylobacterium sp. B1]
MARLIAAALFTCALAASASATPRHRRPTFCTPVYIEGAGTVRICAPARGR